MFTNSKISIRYNTSSSFANEISQRKNLENKLNDLSNKLAALNSLENSIEIDKPHVTPTLFLLLKSQIDKKARFSNDLKQLALNIYFLGPQCINYYKFR